jgi:hypothetical protein
MPRRRRRRNDFLGRHGNKLAVGFVLLLLASFVIVLKMPGHPVSAWPPGWQCLNGSYGICFKKSPPSAN